jgi:hypothetical protein
VRQSEFNRLWGHEGAAAGAAPELQNEALTEAARALEQQTLSSLMARYDREVNSRPRRPRAIEAIGRVFERSALVVAIARRRADYRCEVSGCQHPAFLCADGTRYCLCPAHHREVHVGKSARNVTEALQAVRLKDSRGVPQREAQPVT